MDLTIQSLVQSPYMRAMAVVPTKSEQLVHGIHDHLPPLVKTQVKVTPIRNPGTNGRWIFNIPRRGLWHSAQLVVRPKQSSKDLTQQFDERQLRTASTFVEAIENIELFSKQRFIERLIPEAIVSEMLGKSQKMEQWYQFSYADVNPATDAVEDDDVAWPDIATNKYVGGLDSSTDRLRCRPHYIIPLPLSCFTSMKKNFQTLFVESLSLVVQSKDFGYFDIDGYDMELHCEYHSFHPNVETVIRNANYKQSIPATLPWHDWIQFDQQTNNSMFIEYSLESDALISKILVVPQWKHMNANVKTMKLSQNLYIVIRSLSEVLFEGSVASLRTRYDLCMDETDATQAVETILDDAYSFYIPIHFGLRRDQERFTGGLALSSITNPRIQVYPNENVYRSGNASKLTDLFPSKSNYEAMDFKILGKRHFFLRIDSDTGVITRSIES
jgi:hypothetical protein